VGCGEAGGVAPYLLTNAIESGDVAGALEVLHRLLTASGPQQPKPMHPLQLMGTLLSYYRRVLRLDDSSIRRSAAVGWTARIVSRPSVNRIPQRFSSSA
jgi:DNA polymerase III delta subunit